RSAHRTQALPTRKPARGGLSARRRERDLNPRRTFQHVRDFQSRSLDRSDTPPSAPIVDEVRGGDRVARIARVRLRVIVVAALAAAALFAAAASGRPGSAACTPGVKSSGSVTYRTFCGPAHATAKVGGKTFTFSGGTCAKLGGIFTVNLGTISLGAPKPKYPYFGLNVSPPQAGAHAGQLVAFSVPGKRYSLLHATVTLKAGLRGGTFSGAVFSGGTASGSFSC